jgi:signal transduction histidine kinase
MAEQAGRLANAGGGSARETALAVATSEWLRGEASLRLDNPSLAKPLFTDAFDIVKKQDPGSALQADILVARARLESTTNQVQAALADYLAAFDIYKQVGNRRQQAATLQDMGILYHNAGDNKRSLSYYEQSRATYVGDPLLDLSVDNNRADALNEIGSYREAERDYTSALKLAQKMGSPSLEAQILSNLAVAQFSDRQYAAAEASVVRGLRLARDQDASAMLPTLLSTRAQLDLREGRIAQAQASIDAIPETSGADLASERDEWVHRTKYEVYKAEGRSQDALQELETFQRIQSGHRSLMSSASTALMAARFDFDNQNARIAMLKTGELRRDIALTRLRALQGQLILGGLLIIVTALIIFLTLYVRSLRRSHRRTQAINTRLEETNNALEEALQAKTQFLATTSHEIRTPLNGVLGMTEVLLAGEELSDRVRQRVALIHGAGESMRILVDDLLDMSKMDAGQITLQPEPLDFPNLMREIARFWRAHAESAGLNLSLELTDAPTMIVEDARRLRQILSNLLSNAVKFTPAGSITMSAVTSATESGERLIVRVSDTGIGISEELREFIFDKFTQVDASVTRKYGGTGLGLSIARSLARAMGGDITVDANEVGGADFLVDLPLERVPADIKPETNPGAAARALIDLKIVIVEPNLITQGALRSLLERRVDSIAFLPRLVDAMDVVASLDAHVLIASFPKGGRIPGDPTDREMCDLGRACRHAGIDLVIILDSEDIGGVLALNIPEASYLDRPINAVKLVKHLESLYDLDETVSALRA